MKNNHRGDMSREGSIGLGGSHGPKGWNKPSSHAGLGPRGYIRADGRIFEDVCDRLTDSPDLDATDLEVAVAQGIVVLGGWVDYRGAKYLAEDLAASVPGVQHVMNQIRVRAGRPRGEGSQLTGSAPHEGMGLHADREQAKRETRRTGRHWVAR